MEPNLTVKLNLSRDEFDTLIDNLAKKIAEFQMEGTNESVRSLVETVLDTAAQLMEGQEVN